MEKLAELIENYRTKGGTLIGLLQDISDEFGYLPEDVLGEVSRELDTPLSLLYSLATFYTSFRLEPIGKHHVCVCMGTACHVRGAERIVDLLERELGVKAGETTDDQEFTIETVRCLGACALAPLIVFDGEYHGEMDQEGMTRLLKNVKKGDAQDPESAPKESGGTQKD
jgi:NADH:ubiquinone oxidoreductase subunit E